MLSHIMQSLMIKLILCKVSLTTWLLRTKNLNSSYILWESQQQKKSKISKLVRKKTSLTNYLTLITWTHCLWDTECYNNNVSHEFEVHLKERREEILGIIVGQQATCHYSSLQWVYSWVEVVRLPFKMWRQAPHDLPVQSERWGLHRWLYQRLVVIF